MNSINLCQELFNWGSMDIEFLEGLINGYELDTEQLSDSVKDLDLNVLDINSWIYGAMYLIGNEIKELIGGILDNLTEDDEDELFNRDILAKNDIDSLKEIFISVDMDIYSNYIDTFFNNELYQWAMEDFDMLIELFNQVQGYTLESEYFTMWDELQELFERIEKDEYGFRF